MEDSNGLDRSEQSSEDDELIRLSKAVKLPPVKPAVKYEHILAPLNLPTQREQRARQAVARFGGRPSPKMLFDGTFNFLFYREMVPRLVTLVSWAVVVSMCAVVAFFLSFSAMLGGAFGLSLLTGMLLSATAVALGGMWLVFASARWLAVLEDTANGTDRIENWPDAIFIDSFGATFYVVGAAIWSAMLGLVIGTLLGGWAWVIAPFCLMAFFPIVMLSMLESGSLLWPVSGLVLRSMTRLPGTWAVFYAITFALASISIVTLLVLQFAFGIWAWPIVAGIGVIESMIYFRVLGKLALCCVVAEQLHQTAKETVEETVKD